MLDDLVDPLGGQQSTVPAFVSGRPPRSRPDPLPRGRGAADGGSGDGGNDELRELRLNRRSSSPTRASRCSSASTSRWFISTNSSSRSNNPIAVSRSPSRTASASTRSTPDDSPPASGSLPGLNADEKALHKGFFVARTGDNGVAVARIDGRIGRDGSLRNLVLSAAGFAVRTKSPGNRHLRGEAPVAAASSSPARCETPRCGYTGVAWRSSRCSCPAGTATRSGGRTAKDASATRTEGQDQEEILRPLSYETPAYRNCTVLQLRYWSVRKEGGDGGGGRVRSAGRAMSERTGRSCRRRWN